MTEPRSRTLPPLLVSLLLVLTLVAVLPPDARAAAEPPVLHAGEQLDPGERLISPDGRKRLVMQTDGNLVLYSDDGVVRWHTRTSTPGSRLVMQADGNLVVYRPDDTPAWQTDTDGTEGRRLALQDDGNLVVYTPDDRPVWQTATNSGAGTATLYAGEGLAPGERLRSASGALRFVMQADGNLVLYTESGRVLWHTDTDGRDGARLAFQGDGNLVVYDTGDRALWHSHTDGDGGRRLVVQDDGNVVVYSGDGRAVWQTGTRFDPSSLAAVGTLASGERLQSPNGAYELRMQTDGNLVLYDAQGRPQWYTATSTPGSRLRVQDDGNVVVYTPSDAPVWQTDTRGSDIVLVVQDDGNVVVYDRDGRALWDRLSAGGHDYSLPVARSALPRSEYDDPHHSYPAIDLPVPEGTGIYAVKGGTVASTSSASSSCGIGVTIAAADGGSYTYCHFSRRDVGAGATVATGQRLGLSGNTGNSTGPHLHLSLRVAGQLRCPQSLLLAVYDDRTVPSPGSLPTTGCFY